MKKIVLVDGGLGRCITAIPAVERLAEEHKEGVIVIASHVEPFMYNNKIERVYSLSHPYLFEDVIEKNELLHPEPYTYYKYYKDKIHLIDSFSELLGVKAKDKPNLYLEEEELDYGDSFRKNLVAKFNKPILIFQPFGATAKIKKPRKTNITHFREMEDKLNRSINYDVADKLIEKLKDKFTIVYFGDLLFANKDVYLPTPKPCLRQWFSIINEADAILSVDSALQHIARAFEVPGVVLTGGTYSSNITYEDFFKVYKRKDYPKAYNPIRIDSMDLITSANKKNLGAMDFDDKDIDKIVKEVIKLIGD